GSDLDLVAFRGQPLAAAVWSDEDLLRASARLAAQDAPGVGQPAVVVDRDLARLQIDVALLDPVAAAVEACPARVLDVRAAVDPHGIVGLEALGRDVLEQRPPGAPVHPIAY